MATSLEPQPAKSADKKKHSGSAASPLAAQAGQPTFWTESAPGKVRKGGAPAYLKYVRERKQKGSLARLCRATGSPLAWGLAVGELPAAAQELLALAAAAEESRGELKSKAQRRIVDAVGSWIDWTTETAAAPDDWGFALAALAAAHLLNAAAGCVEDAAWWQGLDALARISDQALAEPLTTASPSAMLSQQLLAVELPLTLAWLFPEAAPLAGLCRRAADRLAESTEELLNGQGLLHGTMIGGLLPLAACWTRLIALGGAMKKSPWTKRSAAQYGWIIRQTLRWTAPGGRPLLADPIATSWSADFLQAALRLGGDRSDAAAAETLLGRGWLGRLAGAAKTHETPAPADECEWSGLAMLRTNWSAKGAVVAVDYSGPQVRIEATVGKQQLMSGEWKLDVQVGGQSLFATGAWEETCWFSDADVDFIELSLDLGNGRRVDRQILLTRQQQMLMLADYFIAGEEGELHYAARVPLGAGTKFHPEAETRDGLVKGGDAKCRVLPLALAEWRTDPRGGELAADDSAIGWSTVRQGAALAAALLIDLHPGRSLKPCTWRQLTVAELLDIKTPDAAVAFRAQSGKEQWLFYRSLGPRGNRTFLGQNTSSEFLAGRFNPETGLLEELVEIEG